MRKWSLVGSSLTAALIVMLAACDDGFKSRIPTTPGAPSLLNLEIVGPSSIAPNGVGQLTARMKLSDGTTKLASNARWFVSNTFFLRIDAAGVATGQGRAGETSVTVEVTGLPGGVRRATREIIVVPDGTYRMIGSVFDSEFSSSPVVGARVEAAPGQFATTDASGSYRLYGVQPNATIQISKTGYHTLVESVSLNGHAAKNFNLAPAESRIVLSGNYTLSVDVVGSCTSIPNDLQHRRYDAVVSQNGLKITVVLTEPRFRKDGARGDRFFGTAGVNGATFTLATYVAYYYYYFGFSAYPDVAERLSDGTHLIIDGLATVTGSAAGLTGTLSGGLHRYDSRFPNFPFWMGGCSGSAHQFSLMPR